VEKDLKQDVLAEGVDGGGAQWPRRFRRRQLGWVTAAGHRGETGGAAVVNPTQIPSLYNTQLPKYALNENLTQGPITKKKAQGPSLYDITVAMSVELSVNEL